MVSLKYKISLLDCNTRFALWQIKMQAVLAQMDLEDALLGIDKMPSTLTDEEKKRKDRKALTQLHLHLSNEILQDMMKEKTAVALCKRLEQICMSKTLTSKLHMKQRLYAHRLEEGAYVHEHLTVERVSLLVGDKIGMLIMIVEGHRNGILTVNLRVDRSLQTEGKQPENFGEADIVENYSDGELLVACVNDSKVSKEWILDSGCTFHMSPNQAWFTTYETVSEDVVLMGNNASCKIVGVGTIKVKMFDEIVKTLSDVRHVPELKRNLISLSTLDSKGYRYTAESELSLPLPCQMMMAYAPGAYEVPSRGGANYMITFIDDFSRKVRTFFLKQKSDIVQVRRDREILDSLLYSTAKWRCRTNEQNDHGEGLMYVVKCQLTEVVLGRSSLYCIFLINRSPFVAIEKKTPQEVEHQINTESTPQASTKIENRVASSPQYSIAKNRTRREIKPPKKYAEADLVAYALNVAEDIDANQEPSNYSKAISCEDSEKWMFAMQEEMESLYKNRTWDLVKLPKGKKVVRCKWVFKKKEGTLGVEEPRYKARLVAKGYNQILGVDFTDVFSPVVKHSSIRVLLGIVAMHDLELEQLDVKTAFLHGELKEDIYIQQLEGFTVLEKEDYVYLLKKSLYGLK
ncbi:hypothetical protein CXB51_005523 [Gossypium anomalum]|uniref:Reverse transcriptase Ty1/copia-type domain-containing protein n=1 Tax=Gossypium anomalum TaxID=47600 RepID=A0A8J5ZDX2_9ROSI|nr:hypothetical protein CXB51_005523 [Gossypium anomalum]